MADDTRDKTGPLSPVQMDILAGIAGGRTHAQVGEALGMGRVQVSTILNKSILPKMGCRRSQEAIARYSHYKALIEVAELLRKSLLKNPLGEAEEHVNHVIEGFAREFQGMAQRLLP